MENKELETWLKETKAKNLSRWELQNEIDLIMNKGFLMQLKGSNNYTKASILFNQWQKEAEFSPKRGDRVLVWNTKEEEAVKRIFLTKLDEIKNPIVVVTNGYETDFEKNNTIGITSYEHMKPLPIEQPKETDFKSQVIELIEDRMRINNKKADACYDGKDAYAALNFEICNSELEDILEKVKKLC